MVSRFAVISATGLMLLGLAGCSHSAGDLCLIEPGCSRAMVRQHLGKPTMASASKNIEIYRYELVTPQGGASLPQTEAYYVRIVDGTVESYGKWSEMPSDPQ